MTGPVDSTLFDEMLNGSPLKHRKMFSRHDSGRGGIGVQFQYESPVGAQVYLFRDFFVSVWFNSMVAFGKVDHSGDSRKI